MWAVLPLEGKYYGTICEDLDTGDRIVVWLELHGNYTASKREIEAGWEPDHGYNHVELQASYDAAMCIVRALNYEFEDLLK